MWSEWCLPSDVLDLRRRRQARSLAGKQRVREWRPTALTRLPEPEPISVGDWVRSPSFGAIFEWTELHMTASRLAPWRDRGDRAVDDYVTANPLRWDTDPVTILYSPSDTTPPQSPHAELCRKLETPPSWEIDWAAVERGQAVFVAYWPAASLTLWFTSLVGGFSAPLITEVIRCTGYLTGNRAGRRLIETFQMVLSCSLCGSDGLRPEGDGWETILRVRFLHAGVRRRLANVADGTKCEHLWDRGVYGVPINQEDLAVTLLAFSLNVIDGIELLRGWPLSPTEQEDFLHLWAVIGWAIGVEDECNPCYRGVAHAQAMLDSIMMHELEPNHHSRAVAAHLLPSPVVAALAQRFLGQPLSTALGLPAPDWKSAAAATTYFWCHRVASWLWSLPGLAGLWRVGSEWVLRWILARCQRRNPTFAHPPTTP